FIRGILATKCQCPPEVPIMQAPKPNLPDSAYDLDFNGVTAAEQYMVELVNRARMNPEAEDGRQGTNYINGSNPAQAVAIVGPLSDAAQQHSDDMVNQGFFAHTNPFTNKSPSDRARDEGYGSGAAENIALGGGFEANKESEPTIDGHHGQFWNSTTGHRGNFLNDRWSEVGIGQTVGDARGEIARFGNDRSFVTQNFGDRGINYLTGVVIDDRDGDNFYDIGEGQGDVRITAWNDDGSAATSTWDAGGYSLALRPGTYTVQFEGGDLDGTFTTEVTIGSDNVKLDVIEDRDATGPNPGPGPDPDPTPSPVPVPTPAPTPPVMVMFEGDSGDNELTGNEADNIMLGRAGDDVLEGEDGADMLRGGKGDDELYGGRDDDMLRAHGGDDYAKGGQGDDDIRTGAGDDTAKGGKGDDVIGGGRGDDWLNGGQGNDRISGDQGDDTMVGRSGNDSFVYGAGGNRDQILDFANDADQLVLDQALWSGTLTAAEVVDQFATESGGDTTFDFGGGHELTLAGVGATELIDDIGFL
ncbi:MAG: CAP domain-containing protein, partial [Pseudomonadota bacterium]